MSRDALGVTRADDLGDADLGRIRALTLIELTALFDIYNISYIRRKPKKRLKGDDARDATRRDVRGRSRSDRIKGPFKCYVTLFSGKLDAPHPLVTLRNAGRYAPQALCTTLIDASPAPIKPTWKNVMSKKNTVKPQ